MNTSEILMICNIVISGLMPIIANVIQTIINKCTPKRSKCCGGVDIEYIDSPIIKKNNSNNNLNK